MSVKNLLRGIYLSSIQIDFLIRLSRAASRFGVFGKAISIALDNLMLTLYGIELTSRKLDIKHLVVGHSTGVVLGGNGIRCTGKLHLSSGVVFARRYSSDAGPEPEVFFDIEGDLTVGANTVILGPAKICGPVTLGALTLVTRDILEPGVYVGTPARKIDERRHPVADYLDA
jgi:serine acetyltransferase